MMIPIALDFSNHDAFPEHQPDASDFMSLLNCLRSTPCVLLYNGDTLADSTLITQQHAIPVKFRDMYKGLLQRLPKQTIPAWNGIIDNQLPPFAYENEHILAVSRATYCVALENDLTDVSVRNPAAPHAEITMWKSIDATQTYDQVKSLLNREILVGDLRSVLWQDRMEPVIKHVKWRSITIVDRYFIGDDKRRDYEALDYLIGKINATARTPLALHIHLETKVPSWSHKHPGEAVDAANELLQHLAKKVSDATQISQINIYAHSESLMKNAFHDRFMFLNSADELLYSYSFGAGFIVFSHERIKRLSTFQMKVDLTAREHPIYQQLLGMRPHRSIPASYSAEKVKIFLCTQ